MSDDILDPSLANALLNADNTHESPMAAGLSSSIETLDIVLLDTSLAGYEDLADTAQAVTQQMVFLDTAVEDYETLMAGMDPTAEIVLLDPQRDGVEQIAETLEGRSGVDAIHLIAEGDSAQLRLGSSLVTQASINGQYADLFGQIGASLSADADLLIYGCNFGEGVEGTQAAQTLAALTGADVAASDDLTGHQSLGADWDLEVQVGDIESGPLIDQQARDLWVNALALPTAANNTVSTHEDTTYTFAANDFGYSDADGDAMVSVKITTLEAVGALQLNSVDVTLNQ
ncbi:MAG: DUF4347 domain-containing protein, partial [bacterium]|nr:DUF4347 domain-containing protein [bacterium]